jgi:MinD-like ATPase involved in chromosome partitioning or flagellar assembly/tetratricopeptide (TPR) repeat protein
METITFYSYKGGVGRTLALANIALYLSRFGQNVCIMDFDLEAPGLHYKFPKIFKPSDIRGGLVDYIYEFTHNKVTPKSLDNFSLEVVSPSKSQGEIRLIPAGDVLSSDYWRKLASINWHSLFYAEGSEGVPFFLELKERIFKEIAPDFLLIDSRTGVTEMGGLCTSLLPDDVVFLIVNNQENIEGARQILRSIQKVERLPGQKPIGVTFALNRIPFPEEEKDKVLEEQIVTDVQNFLNEPVEDLESQLNVQDICILHSDRELELSESLRISQEGLTKETPLLQDYLRLFSKIIPDEVILPKLDSVLEEITANILEKPDKTQEELEGLVISYPHPKSLEKLIDFYILRNAGREKMLGAFHDLWRTFGIDNPKILSKYVSFFMKWELSQWREPNFKLATIERYLELRPEDRIAVEKRLAEAYKVYARPEMALKHYLQLLKEVKEKDEILGKILDIYIEKKLYADAMTLFEKYSDIIDTDISLRVKKVEVMFKEGKVEEVQKMLDDGGITESALSERKPSLYFSAMEGLGKSEEVNKRLNIMLTEAFMKGNPTRLRDVGKIFYNMGRADEFKNKISGKTPFADRILRDLDSGRDRFF